MAGEMPRGQAALHPLWPDARWNISGLFVHDTTLLAFLTLLKDRYDCTPCIDGVHGAPNVLWNSGRPNKVDVPKDENIQGMVDFYNTRNIGVYFTFSNHLLHAAALDDPVCNHMLKFLNNGRGLNGVILASDILYDHVRSRFPDLKLTASIVKVAVEGGQGKRDYYASQCQRFDSVMLHPDDAFRLDLLDDLDREKMEIIVNENCVRHCAIRPLHYEMMVRQYHERVQARAEGRVFDEDAAQKELHDDKGNVCLLPALRLDGHNRSCNLAEDELEPIYELGYRRFKLQGRGDAFAAFIFDLTRFLLEPRLLHPVVYKAFTMGAAGRYLQDVMKKRKAAKEPPPPANGGV